MTLKSLSTPAPQVEVELKKILTPIYPDLEKMSEFFVGQLQSDSLRIQELINHVSRYRGKRLRSAQVLLTGKGFGNFTQAHIKVAAIVEMIHTATLVHDDILDEAEIRRRLPSVNAGWGNASAVLLGDYIYAKAFWISTHLESQLASQLLSEVTRTICQGEIEQIAGRYNFALREEKYLEVIGAKTASLYAAACELGAAYANAPAAAVQAMRQYGWALGMAFQIIDDCLDLQGNEAIVGKSLGTDVEEGKITLPIIYLLSKLNQKDKYRLAAIYRDPKERNKVAALHAQFDVRCGLDYAFACADAYIRECLQHLAVMPKGEARQALEIMANYVLSRKW